MRIIYLFIASMLLSCANHEPKDLIPLLNGYWEISQVEMPEGSIKEFTVNANVDYLMLTTDSTGIRKKLAPKLDGTFAQTKSAEKFTIRINKDSLILNYQTPFSQWQEVVTQATEEYLILKNSEGVIYTYKKYTPVNILINE